MSHIDEVLKKEDGYVNDPNDSGGETNHGITEATARRFGYKGPMKDLSPEVASIIIREGYWKEINGDKINDISVKLSGELLDTAVNCGTLTAIKFLQKSLNSLTYSRLEVDGIAGPKTIDLLKSYVRVRGEHTILKALNCLQGVYYLELADRRHKDKAFIHGWLNKRVAL